MEDLVETFRNYEVSFQVWEKANGGGSGVHDFTSVTEATKKLLLKRLPDKLKGVIKPGTDDDLITLWQVR